MLGPFQLAIALTVLCLVLIILWWDENYGGDVNGNELDSSSNKVVDKQTKRTHPSSRNQGAGIRRRVLKNKKNTRKNQKSAIKAAPSVNALDTSNEPFSFFLLMYAHPEVALLGLSQAVFEGAVYSFVFMWVPVLLEVNSFILINAMLSVILKYGSLYRLIRDL